MKGSIDRFIVDPPFLSEDCQTRGMSSQLPWSHIDAHFLAAMTVKWLSKSLESIDSDPRLIVCTGERMESLIQRLYRTQGVLVTTFEPKHAKGLSNEFLCYSNFECEKWKCRKGSD